MYIYMYICIYVYIYICVCVCVCVVLFCFLGSFFLDNLKIFQIFLLHFNTSLNIALSADGIGVIRWLGLYCISLYSWLHSWFPDSRSLPAEHGVIRVPTLFVKKWEMAQHVFPFPCDNQQPPCHTKHFTSHATV